MSRQQLTGRPVATSGGWAPVRRSAFTAGAALAFLAVVGLAALGLLTLVLRMAERGGL